MLSPKLLLIALFVLLFWSCRTDSNSNFAIKDFRIALQPHLIKIVSKGIVMYSDSSLRHMATDNELIQLTQSEHPVLRASAFREIINRKSFNHFDILMNHLSDTADVATDAGEFGILHRTVSDDILQEAEWKTKDEKSKTVEQVLTKHNYLRSAYIVLERLGPQEKYYPFIKDMATRPRHLSDGGYELYFDDIEYALYGLSKFKKSDDVKIIKGKMRQNVWKLSNISFRLMKEFPDTAYFDVLQAYHWRNFYDFRRYIPNGFARDVTDRTSPEDFIQALVAQQNDKSANLLDTILRRLPLQTCMPDKDWITNEVMIAIWEHPCPAYARLLRKIKQKVERVLPMQLTLPLDSSTMPMDTIKKIINWYN